MTARFAMNYVTENDVPSDTEDLDSENGQPNDLHYSGALASSAYDEKKESGAKDILNPDGKPFFDYAGTAARFTRADDGASLKSARDFGYLDLGAHGFRGRHWVTDKSEIQLSWDRPHDFVGTIDDYSVKVLPYDAPEVTLDDESEDAALDLTSINLSELPVDQPHIIEIRANSSSGLGDASEIPFGYDTQAPSLDIIGVGPQRNSPYYYFDDSSDPDRIFYNKTALGGTTRTVFDVWAKLGDNASGPWKFIYTDSTAYDYPQEYSADLFAARKINIDTTNSFQLVGYDMAGHRSNAISSLSPVDDSSAPTAGALVFDPTPTLSGVIEIGFASGPSDTGTGANDPSGMKRVEFYVESSTAQKFIGYVTSNPF
ncbi:MAG: fibronectin type III domain-containing protein, partial [Candidatus Omnitrophica bacterium]|nr:fibronectin type III domain-containing protein [Candidatus Omnitrophota bacterium]